MGSYNTDLGIIGGEVIVEVDEAVQSLVVGVVGRGQDYVKACLCDRIGCLGGGVECGLAAEAPVITRDG